MQTGKLVGLMGEQDLIKSIALTITLRDKVVEVDLLKTSSGSCFYAKNIVQSLHQVNHEEGCQQCAITNQ